MRRDQVMKICCNHLIVKGMRLVPQDEKSFNWLTLSDLADGEPKTEKLAVKFKLSETATAFQKVFDDSLTSGSDDVEGSLNVETSSIMANIVKNANTWESVSKSVGMINHQPPSGTLVLHHPVL